MIVYSGLKTAIETYVNSVKGAIFPVVAPEGQPLPYCTYQQIFSNDLKTLDGYAGESSIDFQVNFYATSYVAAKGYAAAFKAGIGNYRGAFGDMVAQDVEFLNEWDTSDVVASKTRYVTMVDVRFFVVTP